MLQLTAQITGDAVVAGVLHPLAHGAMRHLSQQGYPRLANLLIENCGIEIGQNNGLLTIKTLYW